MRGDQHVPARLHRRRDRFVPDRHHARDRVLQALGERQLFARHLRIARVVVRRAAVGRIERGRRRVVAAAPDQHLLVAVFFGRFSLVQARQRAVVALVQTPRMNDRDVHQVHLVLHVPQRADRALQHGRVRDVERVARFLQQHARLLRFTDTLFGQVDIDPAGESVFLVPRRFAVADENEFVHGAGR